MRKFENLINNSFDNLATKLQKNSGCLNPMRSNEGQNVEKEKYMIVINEKGDDAQKLPTIMVSCCEKHCMWGTEKCIC